jgi:hypothetical protein
MEVLGCNYDDFFNWSFDYVKLYKPIGSILSQNVAFGRLLPFYYNGKKIIKFIYNMKFILYNINSMQKQKRCILLKKRIFIIYLN